MIIKGYRPVRADFAFAEISIAALRTTYYFTKAGRNIILQFFSENNIELLTANRPLCIDHIAISKQFVLGFDIHIEEWNTEKTLSDHKGIAVEFA